MDPQVAPPPPEEPTEEALWGEQLLAVVGVDALLDEGRGKIKFTVSLVDQARRLPKAIRQEVRRFLTAHDFDKERAPNAINQKKVLQAVMTFDPTKDLQPRLTVNQPDDTLAFTVAASQALQYLRDIAPKRARTTPMGVKAVPPSDQEASRFRRAYDVCRRMMVVFDDLNEGVLSRDQVVAFAKLFPGLYAETKKQLFLAMADVGAKRPSFELPHERDKLLQVLLQTKTMNPQLEAELQAAFAEEEEKQAQVGPLKLDVEAVQTPTERTEFK